MDRALHSQSGTVVLEAMRAGRRPSLPWQAGGRVTLSARSHLLEKSTTRDVCRAQHAHNYCHWTADGESHHSGDGVVPLPLPLLLCFTALAVSTTRDRCYRPLSTSLWRISPLSYAPLLRA
jgi:hypothetical protein